MPDTTDRDRLLALIATQRANGIEPTLVLRVPRESDEYIDGDGILRVGPETFDRLAGEPGYPSMLFGLPVVLPTADAT